MLVLFIGDVHGKFSRYEKIIKDQKNTIQVGDMGVGFRHLGGPRDGLFHKNPPHAKMLSGNHRAIRGNHDNPAVCRNHSQFIQDGTVEDGVMFVGGGVSIDKEFRIEGYSWWPDEELSHDELADLIELYEKVKPRVMVTHDCPEGVAEIMCGLVGRVKFDFPSRTRIAFQHMWNIHRPDIWIFGHWHFSFDMVLDKTRCICLAELEAKEIDIGEVNEGGAKEVHGADRNGGGVSTTGG